MASPDQMPPLAPLRQRFLRLMRLGALASICMAGVAVMLVVRGDSEVRIDLLIATALGVGLCVLLGIALMTLLFLSNRTGRDLEAAGAIQKEENDPRS